MNENNYQISDYEDYRQGRPHYWKKFVSSLVLEEGNYIKIEDNMFRVVKVSYNHRGNDKYDDKTKKWVIDESKRYHGLAVILVEPIVELGVN